ncbi:MAG: hypothetical protein QXF57_04925, partial [Acidilobaceae archaeon]
FTYSIYDAIATSSMPSIRLGACYTASSCSYMVLGNEWTSFWSPLGVFEIELLPRASQALRPVSFEFTCFSGTPASCTNWTLRGSSSEGLLPTQSTTPYLIEIQAPGGFRAIIAAPTTGLLAVSQGAGVEQRGYVTVIRDAPLTATSTLYWAPALVDWSSLKARVLVDVRSAPLREPATRQAYYVVTGGETLSESSLACVT